MYTKNEYAQTFVASTDMRSHQFHAVDLVATQFKVDLAAAKAGYGILANNPNAGEHAEVVVFGETMVRVGGAVAIGDLVTAAATGWIVDVTSSVAQNVFGRVLTTGASGDIVTIFMNMYRSSSIA